MLGKYIRLLQFRVKAETASQTVLFDKTYFVLKQFFISAKTSENCLKPKARRQTLTRSEDEVFRILKKAQIIGISSDLVSLVLTG